MRTNVLALAVLGALLSGCSGGDGKSAAMGVLSAKAQHNASSVALAMGRSTVAGASIPGNAFAAFDEARSVIHRGAATLLPVKLSEARAIAAIGEGEMKLPTPSGESVRLKYDHHVEHDDGNWTWVGLIDGRPGARAVVTFGEKAVFGTVQLPGGRQLELTTMAGRTYMVQVDESKLSGAPQGADMLAPPTPVADAVAAQGGFKKAPRVPTTASAQAAMASSTIDLVLGYTTGYAAFLGGQSQAITRLHHLVDIANQAYADSKVDGSVRLVKTVQVNYPDASSSETALFEMTGVTCVGTTIGQRRLPSRGVNCNAVARPASLEPLIQARDQYGADLVSLVRVFNNPESVTCGVGWLLGGGQVAIDPVADAPFGFSVVSDSNGVPDNAVICRNETLAHELGHNMGLQHEIASAAGADDSNSDGNVLDPEEFGRFPYAFGHSTASFYTIMAQRQPGQTGFLVFANPSLATCGGVLCGDADTADNTRALNQTMPIVARFRTQTVAQGGNWLRGDFNGDQRADVVWRSNLTGQNTIWLGAGSTTQQGMSSVTNLGWDIAGVGDFDSDGRSDVLWRNSISGQNTIWRSGNAAMQITVSSLAANWQVVGIGDFSGDGQSDILWRNSVTGGNVLWRSGSVAAGQFLSSVPDQNWTVVGVGDFNADGRDDVLWRNTVSGGNTIWLGASASMTQYVTSVPNTAWHPAAVGDFNGDGRADILWRNRSTGQNIIWRSGNSTMTQAISSVPTTWSIIGAGDFDANGVDDILWRNMSTGANTIWRGGSATNQQGVTSVTNLNWIIAG